MTATIEDELTTYLRNEANRVAVRDSLDDIERDVTILSVVGQPKRRNLALPILATAASIAALVGMATVRSGRPSSESLRPGADVVTTTVPVTSPPTTAPILRVPLPAGAVLQGAVPACTTTDNAEFDCTFERYPGADRPIPELSVTLGQTEVIVDDTSRVSGACRALSEDGLRWTCYVGQRAVNEGIVVEARLGAPASREYASG
jgi:hypothetical protein